MGRGRQKADLLPGRPKAEPKTERFVGALALQEAPVFYPTEQEFQDPLQYIAQIRPVAEPFGICRIIPPKSWDPPFALDQQKFSFPTKLQAIHQLQERPAACDADTFKLEYGRYLLKEGRSVGSWPIFDGEELDLCKLFNAVKRHGGFEKVKQEKKWVEVIRMVRPKTTLSSLCMQSSASASLLLCQLYEKYLSGYELYQSSAGSRKQSRTPKRPEPKTKFKGKRGTRKGQLQSETDSDMDVVGSGRKRQLQEEADHGGAGPSGKSDQSPERKRVKMDEGFHGALEREGRSDQICEQCNSGAHEQMMLLCDRCDRGWHLYCLSPPLSAVPHGNWYCLDCISSERDSFGFSQGQKYSLDSFRRMADRFKRKWFGSASVTYAELEKEFWRVVERATAPVEVLYGSDLDVATYGSGFPRKSDAPGFSAGSKDLQVWESHVNNPWNLNNFPKLNGSMLRLVDDNIPGVIVPWVYIGMLFSSFCWHYEDHCFYSVNYLHWGEPKTWYSVPGSAAEAFEQVMRKSFPDLFEAQPDLLFQLVTMLNPNVLRESGVPVCTTVQEPRNFVITFPKSYHGGFNHGFNCAEAVNFAPVDWLPFGAFAVERYRLYHKSAVLSHDELLCVVATNDRNARSQLCLEEELSRIVAAERSERELLWKSGVVKSSRMTPRISPEHVGTEEDPECIICRYYLHLSAVVCSCRPGKAVCLQHARQLCECSTSQQRLMYRYSLAELDDLLNVDAPECKLEDAPVGARPSRRKSRAQSAQSTPLSKKVKNRVVKHVELAEAWIAQAKSAQEQCLSVAALEDLLMETEQFLWAGHEMDEVRQLESELTASSKWAREIAACTSALEQRLQAVGPSKPPRVSLNVAEQLIATEPVCNNDNLAKLKEQVETARLLQQQIKTALESSSSLEMKTLQALQLEAMRCPFELPELQQIKDIVSYAQSWSERARKMLPISKTLRNRATNELPGFEQLLNLQTEGKHLSVIVSELNSLDVAVKQINDWQARANELLNGASSLQELEEILVEAEGLPVHLPEIELLETRIGKARDWVLRAQESLSDIQQPDDYSVSIKLLQDLLSAGELLDVYSVAEVKVVQKELKKLSWMYSASKALLELPSTKTVTDLLEESARLGLPESTVMLQIQELAAAAAAWEAKAKRLLENRGGMEEFTECIRAASRIQVALNGLYELRSAVHVANDWLGRAQPLLSQTSSDGAQDCHESGGIEALQALIAESETMPVKLQEVEGLTTLLSVVEKWISKSKEIEELVRMDLEQWEEHSDNVSKMEDLIRKVEEIVQEGLNLGYRLPEVDQLQHLVSAVKWTMEANSLLLSGPTMKEVKCILADGKDLGVRIGMLERLKSATSAIESWLSSINLVIPASGSKSKCTEGQLEHFLSEVENFDKTLHRLWSSEYARLQQVFTDHRAWQREVREVISGSASHLSWSDLTRLQATGQVNPVENKEMDLLNAELVEGGLWISRCFKAIVGRSACGSFSLREVLLQMQKSVENALQQVGTDEIRGERPFVCICQDANENFANNLLHCDSCEDWYHPSCLGLVQAHTRGHKQYVCPFCTAVCTGVLTLNEDSYAKIHVTRRPTLTLLRELLSASRTITCRLQEIELLGGIIRSVETWQGRVADIIGPALVQHNFATDVDSFALLAALKAEGAMEVQEDEGAKIAIAVAANAWRIRARKLLDSPAKPYLRSLSRAVKEGLSVPVSTEDYVLKELRELEAYAFQWAARAKEASGDLGEIPVEEVHALVVEGERLPVNFTKEIAALRARCVLYCVCQKPYDEDRAMIACDRCSEWYHFSCLDLPEPEKHDEDCDQVLVQECHELGEFICPKCRDPEEETPDGSQRHELGSERTLLDEVLAIPRAVRGKRSSRNGGRKSKSGAPQKWRGEISGPSALHWELKSNEERNDSPENSVSPSGRPCRRTAGRHSGFESFVLLNVRSR